MIAFHVFEFWAAEQNYLEFGWTLRVQFAYAATKRSFYLTFFRWRGPGPRAMQLCSEGTDTEESL